MLLPAAVEDFSGEVLSDFAEPEGVDVSLSSSPLRFPT